MLASVVIITRNRPHVIENCIKSIMAQDYGKFEIIVVDSSSDIRTKEIIAGFFGVKYIYFKNGKNQMPASRNLGIEASKGEIIAFVDDDTLVGKGWLYACIKAYKDPGIGAVGGRIIEPDTRQLDHSRTAEIGKISPTGEFIANFDCDPGKSIEVDTLRGCNMSFNKEVFSKVGVFDPNYTANNCREEADLITRAKRAGFKVIFEPEMILEHLVEKREDVDRVKTSTKSNFYITKNTTYYFLKNYSILSKESVFYTLTKDTSLVYFFKSLSLNAFVMVFVGFAGKIAGFWTYIRWLVLKGRMK